MKKILFTINLLCFFTVNAQQNLVQEKKIDVIDSFKLRGVWYKTIPPPGWNLTGNAGTNANTSFIGSTNAVDFVTRTNNVERLRLSSGSSGSQLFKVSGTSITNGITTWINSGATSGIGLYVDANSLTSGRMAEFSTTSQSNFINGAFRVVAQEAHTGSLVDFYSPTLTGHLQKITGFGLTTGTGLEINSASGNLNSTNGLLYVNNAGASTNGILARFRANSTAGSGLTIKANGFSGFGTSTPLATVDIAGTLKYVDGNQAAGKVFTSNENGLGSWQSLPNPNFVNGNGTTYIDNQVNIGGELYLNTVIDGTAANVDFSIISSETGFKTDRVNGVTQIGNLSGTNGDNIITVKNSIDAAFYSQRFNNGKFGINNDNPAVALDVFGEINFRAKNISTNTFIIESSTGYSIMRVDEMSKLIAFDKSAEGFKVGIGTPAPSETLDVNGNIIATGTITPSDERYKQNIQPFANGLFYINKLLPKTYEYKTMAGKNFNKGMHYGLIAQDVEKVLPEIVSTNNSGFKGVNYTEIIPVLIAAIKQQQLQIDEQKAEILKIKAVLLIK